MDQQRRLMGASAALTAYQQALGYTDGPEEVLSDLLADLMHHADANEIDFADRLATAEINFTAERWGED